MSLSQYGTVAKSASSDSVPPTNGTSTQPRLRESINVSNDSVPSEILDENAFVKLLCLERKRTERSGRRFILMLLDLGTLLKSTNTRQSFRSFINTISESIRETDIKGWYKSGSVFGVIFTEIGNGATNTISKVLLDKTTAALWSTLRVDDINDIRVSFHVYPEENLSDGNQSIDLTLYPDEQEHQHPKHVSRFVKRAIDILGSLCAIIVLSPLLLTISVLIKVTSRGPILFRQNRIGRYGATFTFLKFRSMYIANDETIHMDYVTQFISGKNEAEKELAGHNEVFKLKNDPRVTRMGRLLRRSSLDELPQFLNVLRGEMSLVGPRPPVPYEVACYKTWHRRRLMNIKPGITGLWQVGGRSKVKFDDMVRLDLKYAATWSVWLDIKILMKTPAAVVSGEGAF